MEAAGDVQFNLQQQCIQKRKIEFQPCYLRRTVEWVNSQLAHDVDRVVDTSDVIILRCSFSAAVFTIEWNSEDGQLTLKATYNWSLCCAPGTNTTLWINYTPIKTIFKNFSLFPVLISMYMFQNSIILVCLSWDFKTLTIRTNCKYPFLICICLDCC